MCVFGKNSIKYYMKRKNKGAKIGNDDHGSLRGVELNDCSGFCGRCATSEETRILVQLNKGIR